MCRQAQDPGAPGSLRGKALPTAQEGGWDGPRFPSISSLGFFVWWAGRPRSWGV